MKRIRHQENYRSNITKFIPLGLCSLTTVVSTVLKKCPWQSCSHELSSDAEAKLRVENNANNIRTVTIIVKDFLRLSRLESNRSRRVMLSNTSFLSYSHRCQYSGIQFNAKLRKPVIQGSRTVSDSRCPTENDHIKKTSGSPIPQQPVTFSIWANPSPTACENLAFIGPYVVG